MCNVLNCPIFSTNRISFAENHPCVQQNLNQYRFVSKKYLETFKGVVTNKNNFTKTSIFSEKIFRKL